MPGVFITDFTRPETHEILAAGFTAPRFRAQGHEKPGAGGCTVMTSLPKGQLKAVAKRAAGVDAIQQVPQGLSPPRVALPAANSAQTDELQSGFPKAVR
jgi:hypothetical protein